MLFASKSLGTTMVDLFEKRTITKRHKRRVFYKERKGSLKAMLPDGPPPVPKNIF
jgi:aminobenzoyl-glutamate utilization protein B